VTGSHTYGDEQGASVPQPELANATCSKGDGAATKAIMPTKNNIPASSQSDLLLKKRNMDRLLMQSLVFRPN
jgi:hypothetical protein